MNLPLSPILTLRSLIVSGEITNYKVMCSSCVASTARIGILVWLPSGLMASSYFRFIVPSPFYPFLLKLICPSPNHFTTVRPALSAAAAPAHLPSGTIFFIAPWAP
jgi:hypothetical protein